MPSEAIEPPSISRPLPPPTGEAFYYITPEEGGAADIEAMWLAEDVRDGYE